MVSIVSLIEKRQTGVSPKEVPGDSNPVPKPQNLNNLGDSAPLSGEANGVPLSLSIHFRRP